MINRQLIRIKTVQLVYADMQANRPKHEVDGEMMSAVESSWKLYNFLLALIVKVTEWRRLQLEAGRTKYIPSDEERMPNLRFVNNRVAKLIADDGKVLTYCDDNSLTSDFDTDLYRALWEQIESLPLYQSYMDGLKSPTFDEDKALWLEILNTVFPNCGNLDETLEGRDIFWNDDLTVILSYVVKAVQRMKETDRTVHLARMFASDTDRQFALELYHQTLDHIHEYIPMLNDVASNWESERMAVMDKVIMATAIAELLHFADIPVRITLNEYIEIAKHYSSPNSSKFVNGLLDRIVTKLREEGRIIKP